MQEVKLVEWLNKETFEVKSLPEGEVIKGIEWVKIPDDAEFAVSNVMDFEFRKGNSWWGFVSNYWWDGCWTYEDFPMGDWKVVWERKTTEVIKDQQMQGDTFTQFIEQRTEVFNKLLQGVKFQYRYNDSGQWHNLTDKSMGHLLKPNVAVREKPQKITIDGIEMDKEAAIKYIQKHY